MRKLTIYISVVCGLLMLSACKDWLEVEPVGQEVLENFIVDDITSMQAVNGGIQPLIEIYKEHSLQKVEFSISDDLWAKRSGDVAVWNRADVLDVGVNAGSAIWRFSYRGIQRLNIVLNRIDDADFSNAEPGFKNLLIGQASFYRAYYYFLLVSYFGEVPLIVEEIEGKDDAKLPRASMEGVYRLINEDLEVAINFLPNRVGDGEGNENGKPTKFAALALRAYVNLQLENWDAVQDDTEEIINSGQFDLVDHQAIFHNDFDSLGTDYSPEYNKGVIFDIRFDQPYNQSYTELLSPLSYTRGAGIVGLFAVTDDSLRNVVVDKPASGNGLIQLFDDGDKRKEVFMLETTDDGLNTNIFEILKYWNGQNPIVSQQDINFPIFRYADVLLMRAEALNEIQGGSVEAVVTLNFIRGRAGLPPFGDEVTGDQQTVRETIWKERRVELCFELKRLLDLNRTGRVKENLLDKQDNIPNDLLSRHLRDHPITGKQIFLLGIPEGEVFANPNLGEQNPGY